MRDISPYAGARMKRNWLLALPVGVAILLAPGGAASQPQPITGCWETEKTAPEHRKICINAELELDQTTFHSRFDSGYCEYYPIVKGKLDGDEYVFTLPPGENNCMDSHKERIGSVPGTLRCKLLDARRLVCTAAWLGYDNIDQIYYRK